MSKFCLGTSFYDENLKFSTGGDQALKDVLLSLLGIPACSWLGKLQILTVNVYQDSNGCILTGTNANWLQNVSN